MKRLRFCELVYKSVIMGGCIVKEDYPSYEAYLSARVDNIVMCLDCILLVLSALWRRGIKVKKFKDLTDDLLDIRGVLAEEREVLRGSE